MKSLVVGGVAVVGSGITVNSAYGYDSVTIVSDGPILTYGAFVAWLAAS